MNEINEGFKVDVNKRLAGVTVRPVLPNIGLSPEQISEEVKDHLSLGNILFVKIIDWIDMGYI